MAEARGEWGSRISFILAAAGSAVGLGNMWKFPYITGMNGGGAFVLVYLVCILLVGLPIMVAEVLLGRMSRSSVVGTFPKLAGAPRTPWAAVGWLGVATGIVILSFYSVVAGWSLHYVRLALAGELGSAEPEAFAALFEATYSAPGVNLSYHLIFMLITAVIVVGGIQRGVERAARVLMPLLLVMMAALLVYATSLPGFGRAVDFVFGFHLEALTGEAILEALGHSFFTLSLGMGAMLTYGSYLRRDDDVLAVSLATSALDTVVALMACLVLFPITFSAGMEASAGPGLVFVSMPLAFAGLPGGQLWALLFFVLLFFAALSSAISLLEVAAAYLIDERGWSRRRAVGLAAGLVFLLGIPSALSGTSDPTFGADAHWIGDRNWFDSFDYLASNWMLPLGGLGIAGFTAWRLGDRAREVSFAAGSRLGAIPTVYLAWLRLLRYIVPVAIVIVMLHALGVLSAAE